MELVEEDRVSGAVPSWLRCLPELFLCRVPVHGAQLEQAVWRGNGKKNRTWIGTQ